MATLINRVHPALSIWIPFSNDVRQFRGGRLEIEEDDPAYAVVMAEASRNPNIVVITTSAQCEWCGESFSGSKAKDSLAAHIEAVHNDKHVEAQEAAAAAVRNTEAKSRAGIACDVCRPAQVFADEDALAFHIATVHASAPVIGDDGEILAEDGGRTTETSRARRRRPGEVDAIPAAEPSE